jgi:aminoglycoside phosphotransferase (APT) family kinase protein
MLEAARLLRLLHDAGPVPGEPPATAAGELERWSRTMHAVPAGLRPGAEDLLRLLADDVPDDLPPVLVHGDFRLGNILARGATVTAVIDWEIWTVGDPRVDVGWFLTNADPETYRRQTRYVGLLPSARDLSEIYTEALGRDVNDVEWFRALASFKSTATWSLIVKHNRRRAEPDPEVEQMATVLPHLLERARVLLT